MDVLRARARHMATSCPIPQCLMDEWIQQSPVLYRDFVELGLGNTLSDAYSALGTVDDIGTIREALGNPQVNLVYKARMLFRLLLRGRTAIVSELLASMDKELAGGFAAMLVGFGAADINALIMFVVDAFSPNVSEVYRYASAKWARAFDAILPLTPTDLLTAWQNEFVYVLVTPEREDL